MGAEFSFLSADIYLYIFFLFCRENVISKTISNYILFSDDARFHNYYCYDLDNPRQIKEFGSQNIWSANLYSEF